MAKDARKLSVIVRLACFGLLHRHDVLRDAGASGPVAGDFADEGDGVGYFKAPNFFGKMGEERKW